MHSKEGELGLTPVMSGEELVSDIPGIRKRVYTGRYPAYEY